MTATTCDTGAALLRAVLADPASDDARLILADWYEENGQADRGEFVRVQCQIAALNAELMSDEDCDATNCPGCGERRELQRRQRELMDAITPYRTTDGRAGQSPARVLWARPAVWNGCGVKFSRGFISEIRLPLALFLEHARDLFAAHPITAVVLTDRESWVNHDRTHWGWWLDNPAIHAPAPDSLPRPLADAMADDPTRYDYGIGVRYLPGGPAGGLLFRSADAAHAALSAACVRLGRELAGRELAGLPPLG